MEPQIKEVLDSIVSSVGNVANQHKQLQHQVDSIDLKLADKLGYDAQPPAFLQKLQENEQIARLVRDKKGSAVLTIEGRDVAQLLRKTTIVSTGTGWQPTSGILTIDRVPALVPEPRQQLWVEDLLPKFTTPAADCGLRQGKLADDNCVAGRRSITEAGRGSDLH
jgi:hypothetical protein